MNQAIFNSGFFKFLFWGLNLNMYVDPPAAGGGTGTPPPADPAAAMLAEMTAMKAEIAALKAAKTPEPLKTPDPSLADKVEADRLAKEKLTESSAAIERNVAFNFGVKRFVEDHKAFLPENVVAIIDLAEKEKYDSVGQKAAELRVEIMEAFFKVQSNVDTLTGAQKRNLADFQKLTKDGKRQESEKVYESVFEPALEMVKRVKKAEELNLAARGYATTAAGPLGAYKQKLLEAAKRVIINKVKKAG